MVTVEAVLAASSRLMVEPLSWAKDGDRVRRTDVDEPLSAINGMIVCLLFTFVYLVKC